MSLYTVCTKVQLLVEIVVDDDGLDRSYVRRVIVDDSMVPDTLEAVLADGGVVEDENGLTVLSKYTTGEVEDHWEPIKKAYDAVDDGWPAWTIGL